jgi:hypothetical protein
MIGHGSPSSSPTARARNAPLSVRSFGDPRCAIIAQLALVLCALFTCSAAAQDALVNETMRLRISWGGGDSTAWHGQVWLDSGPLSNLKLLGLAADGAGSIWLEEGQVRIKSLSAHTFDVIEVAANASENAQLFVELTRDSPSDAGKPMAPIKVPLADILRRPYELRLDDRGNTLKVEHVPSDAIHIVMDRETLIFAPGEQLSFELRPELPDMAPGTTLDIHTTLSPARGDETIWSEQQRLAVPIEGAPTATINVPLPTIERVYTVRVSASRPSGFRPKFFPVGAAPIAERSIDVVVLDTNPPRAATNEIWETVLEVDPTSPGWWERLPTWTQLRRIPGINSRQLGSIRAGTINLPFGRFVELPPTAPGSDPHWQAYSLPVEAVGAPHLLEIEYPANDEQNFGISIVEPNATGVVEGIGRDSGVYVESFGRENAKQTHRMVFWPRTQVPMLLVTNQHSTAAAHFGHIRVLKRSTPQLTAAPAIRGPSDRMVAAYVARPLLAESFGATSGLSRVAGAIPSEVRAVDDWQTFYESATRLSEYVRYGGYNSAVVNVLSDGSAIYPSAHLPSTPLYNTGRGSTDAAERDGLELLLRVFDRDGLALVPALQLAAPLPALEELRRTSNPQTSGLEWVGPTGRTWLEVNGAPQGLAPYYNLLEPRVQQAVLEVVRELVERYGHHTAFAGLSIQLSANGYAQLPPLDWGLDDATIARFEHDTGIQLAATGPNRFAERHALLTREHVDAWRKWRTEQIVEFYAQIAAMLRENGTSSGNRLILTLEDALAHPNLAARVRPNILLANRVDGTLLDAGLDRPRLETIPGVVVCATRYVESMAPLAERAIDFELNEAFAAWQKRADSNSVPAALLYHRPQRRRLAPFPMNNLRFAGDIKLVSQMSAHGAAVRQPYVQTLLQHDPAVLIDGGELLPLGQDDALRSAREITRQLPTTADVTDITKQPVTVRTYAESNGVTLLVVNASPWHADASIMLDVPRATTMKPLPAVDNAKSAAPSALAAGQQPWSMSLGPYAIQAVRIELPGVRVLEVNAKPNQAAKAELAARIKDLDNRDLNAPRAYTALHNPSFEPVGGAGPPAGWRLIGKSATAELDATNPHDGTTCVYFRNEAGVAALESDPFPTPATGQLAVTVLVRGHQMSPGSELRMVIEGKYEGQLYRRSRIVEPTNPNVPEQWQFSKPILVNDLPLEVRGDIQIRFEMTGPGEVWLDCVSVYDLLFPLKFYKFEEAEIMRFVRLNHDTKSAFDDGRIVDCARDMEKYWSRFLAEYTPRIQPVMPIQPAPMPPAQLATPPKQNEQPVPSIGERIKSVFPFVK